MTTYLKTHIPIIGAQVFIEPSQNKADVEKWFKLLKDHNMPLCRIRLFLNKAIVHPNITLTGSFYIIDVELSEGLNTLEFEALNEGLSSSNTAELKIYDENDVLLSSNRWLITTGYKARLNIFKSN